MKYVVIYKWKNKTQVDGVFDRLYKAKAHYETILACIKAGMGYSNVEIVCVRGMSEE